MKFILWMSPKTVICIETTTSETRCRYRCKSSKMHSTHLLLNLLCNRINRAFLCEKNRHLLICTQKYTAIRIREKKSCAQKKKQTNKHTIEQGEEKKTCSSIYRCLRRLSFDFITMYFAYFDPIKLDYGKIRDDATVTQRVRYPLRKRMKRKKNDSNNNDLL